MDTLTVLTIADRAFLPGLAGLINSLRTSGFAGRIIVGAVDALPELEGLEGVAVAPFDQDSLWVGFAKAAFLLREAQGDFVFLDADITVSDVALMNRISETIACGPMLAAEGLVAPTDHRRLRWAARLGTGRPRETAWAYYNGGFLAGRVPRDRSLLEQWDAGMRSVLAGRQGYSREGDFPFGDQDVLNGVVQCMDTPFTSLQLPDWSSAASPLNPFFHLGAFATPALQHCTGTKPWRLASVPPRWAPTAYDVAWFRHVVTDPKPLRIPVALPRDVARWLEGGRVARLRARWRWALGRLGRRGHV